MSDGSDSPEPRRRPVHRSQGYDLLRIVAAGLVLVSHSYLLPTGHEPTPLVFGDYGYTFGRIGVLVFFALSGYLVCGSWLKDPSPARFGRRRARRILPGLTVMLVVTTVLVGPVVTTADHYFQHFGTWEFLVRNLLIFPYDYSLPGVFGNLPLPVVNGVLWTLGVEISAYLLLAAAGMLGLFRRPAAVTVLAGLTLLVSWHWLASGVNAPAALVARLELVAAFAVAAAVRATGARMTGRIAAVAVAVLAVTQVAARLPVPGGSTVSALPLSVLVVPCLVTLSLYLGAAPARWATPIVRAGDPSYGMYVYGYLTQQLMVLAGLGTALGRAGFTVASLLLVTAVGYASWHGVERRFARGGSRPAAPPGPEPSSARAEPPSRAGR